MLISYLYCNQGGVTSVIKQRMPLLLRTDWVVDTVFNQDNGGKADLIDRGIRRVEIYANNFQSNVAKMLRSDQYDLHVIFDTPELLSLQHYYKTKCNFEIHTSIITTLKKYPVEKLASVNAIIVPSNWLKETVLKLMPSISDEKICVIPNLVDPSYFSLDGNRFVLPPTILWVGKFTDYKNWQEAILVARLFLKANPTWNFIMVTGGQPKEGDAAQALTEFIRNDCVLQFRWLHNLNQIDMGKLYRGVANSGGFLLSTSKAESFCLTIHEAMRCGLPVISSIVGPIPEIIKENVSGLLYNVGNIHECLEKCNLYLDSDFREAIITEGQKSLAPFDSSVLGDSYLKVLDSQLN